MTYPKYSLRRVVYTRVELQIIDNQHNRLDYVDPEKSNGKIYERRQLSESYKVIENPRLLTEAEAGLMNLPFEGEKLPTPTPDTGRPGIDQLLEGGH